METGKKYRIRYQIEGLHRVPRLMVAKFLGAEKDVLGRTVYHFSGRPEFGNTDLLASYVTEKYRVPDDTRCYADRKAPK